jgi:tRNA threonylcarbamoyladenosine biosynthesis protein TsaE
MKVHSVRTSSEAGTRRLGERIASVLEEGEVLALKGELGSGKTTLIGGIIAALGAGERVQSPSFVLIRTYHGKFEIKHVDLYRLNPEGVEDLHLEEIYNPRGIMLVEWAGRADWLPGRISTVVLEFVPDDPGARSVAIEGPVAGRMT